jgi:hypothetical protein
MTDWTVGTLKEYLDAEIKHLRDIGAAEAKLNEALRAEQAKAVTKYEDAQREYNIRSNEFRGQLDDQNQMQMPRAEAMTRFEGIEARHLELRDALDLVRGRVGGQASETGGRDRGQRSAREIIAWVIAITMFLLTVWDKIGNR